MTLIWLTFLAGLAGSFHCVGMCGGIVTALSLRGDGEPLRRSMRRQFLYHLGRITTYALLGGAAGLLGSALSAPLLKTISWWLFLGANLCVLAAGAGTALGMHRLNLAILEGSGGRLLARPLRRIMSSTSPLAPYPLGLLLGFLPCGLVYAPLPAAAASASALTGSLMMAALGVGTTPALFLCGSASGAASGAARLAVARCAGVIVALLGGAGVWRLLSSGCSHCGL